MIVESRIKVLPGHAVGVSPDHCIDRLRWLCDVLIDDGVLAEQIAIAAQAQAGLGRDGAADRMTISWARCLVVKDCIAAAKPGMSSARGAAAVESQAERTDVQAGSLGAMRVHVDSLGLRLRKLAVLPRFVFVLRAVEGYPCTQTSVLLDISEAQCEGAYVAALEALGNGSGSRKDGMSSAAGWIHGQCWLKSDSGNGNRAVAGLCNAVQRHDRVM